jgi:hypothetical protein
MFIFSQINIIQKSRQSPNLLEDCRPLPLNALYGFVEARTFDMGAMKIMTKMMLPGRNQTPPRASACVVATGTSQMRPTQLVAGRVMRRGAEGGRAE